MKKYESTEEFIESNDVKTGDFVESKDNLSRYDCWVYNDAQIFGNTRVSNDAQVFGNTRVSNDAQVFGNAYVYD